MLPLKLEFKEWTGAVVLIKLIDVKKVYDSIIFEDVNLHIKRGEKFGIAGKSGAGKSTLLRCINGLEGDYEGQVLIDNKNMANISNEELRIFRKDIGMIFQQFSLLKRLNVYENIALPMKCWDYSKEDIDNRIKEILKLLDLEDKANSKPRELSGGQKQRVAIGRAIAMNPKILLCDEPTSALDPKTSKSITDTLNKINKELGITIVIVSHDMKVLKDLCDRVGIIDNKTLAFVGSFDSMIKDNPKLLIDFLGTGNLDCKKGNIEIFLKEDKNVITDIYKELNIDFKVHNGCNYEDIGLASFILDVKNKDKERLKEYLRTNNIFYNA